MTRGGAGPYTRSVLRAALPALGLTLAFVGGARADPPARTLRWASVTASPSALMASSLSDREAELQAACGEPETGLRGVAREVVLAKLESAAALDPDELAREQRAAGEPHVWPRAWLVSGRALDHSTTLARLSAWRHSFQDIGQRRCGVATAFAPDGTEVIAAVAVDALADLAPVPIRAHTGGWVAVDAALLVPATGAHLVILGPSGEPRTAPTSLSGGHIRGGFAPDRPGAFTLQIVADVVTGPRPVLEAAIFADTEPPAIMGVSPAPGEGIAGGAIPPSDALSSMLLTARSLAGLSPLGRDARLDALALAHARRMARAHAVGHDLGDGDPSQRLESAGLVARQSGENVAHAPTVALAHRALYASPSHRANMLRPEFRAVGVAVVLDPDGSVWVAEEFTTRLD